MTDEDVLAYALILASEHLQVLEASSLRSRAWKKKAVSLYGDPWLNFLFLLLCPHLFIYGCFFSVCTFYWIRTF